MHKIVAMLLWLTAFFLAVYELYIGATGFGYASLVVLPAWVVPVLFFSLGLVVYYVGGRAEGE